MRKVLAILIVVALTASLLSISVSALSAQDMGAYGQIKFNVYSTATPPVQDGVINPGEYGDPVAILNYGDPGIYFNAPPEEWTAAELRQVLPNDMTWYITYDDNFIYIGVTLIDENHDNPNTGPQVWEGDYVEWGFAPLVNDSFDDMRDRARIAMGLGDGGICIYSAGNPSVAAEHFDANEELQDRFGTITRVGDLMTYEIKIPWANFTDNAKPPQRAYMYLQAGIGDTRFQERATYGSYIAVWRYGAPIHSDFSPHDLGDEVGGQVVFHIANFAGAPPAPPAPPVVEEPEESAVGGGEDADAEIADVIQEATRPASPPTGDAGMTALIALLAIATAGVVALKKARR